MSDLSLNFGSAEVGETRKFAGKSSPLFAPCFGGVLAQAAYATLFSRIGHRYAKGFVTYQGISSTAGSEIGLGSYTGFASSSFTYAFGKYFSLGAVQNAEGSSFYLRLRKSTTYNGTPTEVGTFNAQASNNVKVGRTTVGPTAIATLASINNGNGNNQLVVYNDSAAVSVAVTVTNTSGPTMRAATDGTNWAYTINSTVSYATEASILANAPSWTTTAGISGATTLLFGVQRNPVTGKFVVCDSVGAIFTADAFAGPWTKTGQIQFVSSDTLLDFVVLANGDYAATMDNSTNGYDRVIVSVDGGASWRTLARNITGYLTALFGNLFVVSGGYGIYTPDGAGPTATGTLDLPLIGVPGLNWDGSGFLYGGSTSGRVAPPFDMATQFMLPDFLPTPGQPVDHIRLR